MRGVAAALLALTAVVAGCSDDEPAPAQRTSTTADAATTSATAARPETLRILVTNDDGVGAAGIDALVQGLQQVQGVLVVVVAPAENKSGSGGNTTDGPLTTSDAATASGYPATAVQGFPADTITWAITQGNVTPPPDLVMSGINAGQNLGPVIRISGTVGAARAASKAGIPAIALSQGLGDPPDFASGVSLALDWLAARRADIDADRVDGTLWNYNFPTCAASGSVRGTVEVPPAAAARQEAGSSNCGSSVTAPPDDVAAFANGYAPLSTLTDANFG